MMNILVYTETLNDFFSLQQAHEARNLSLKTYSIDLEVHVL